MSWTPLALDRPPRQVPGITSPPLLRDSHAIGRIPPSERHSAKHPATHTHSLQVFGLASILVLPASPIGRGRANAPCAQGIMPLGHRAFGT